MLKFVWNTRQLQWENKQAGKRHQAAKIARKKLTKNIQVYFTSCISKTISKSLKTNHCQKPFVYTHIFILEAEKYCVPYKFMST